MKNKDSKLNLEETLIPYSDSFDLKKDNEIDYILRLGNAYLFEKHILISRTSPYDYDSLEMLAENLYDVINWYHSTVYSLKTDILSGEQVIIKKPNEMLSEFIFNALHKHFENSKEMIFVCDILLLKDGYIYRYLLKENIFLKVYSYAPSDILKLHPEQSYLDSMKEMLCIVVNPKRLAVALGEKAYQKSLILSGQLSFLLQNLASANSEEIKIRTINQFYDLKWLNILGYEDADRILTHIFEIHQ